MWRRLWTPDSSYIKTSTLYLRCLGLVSLIAHLSLWAQVKGLFASQGILPWATRSATIESYGAQRAWDLWDYWQATRSLLYWNPSDEAIHICFAIGTLASIGIALNRFTGPLLLIAWLSYTSLASAGSVFLSFQWDILLSEMLLMALLLGSWRQPKAPTRIVVTAHRLLFFKLMILAGAVKLLSQDSVWLDGTALTFHYWTQPLPHPLSYVAHSFPLWFHKASCYVMFFIELVVPFFIFGPAKYRKWAFVLQLALQLAILMTGNYGFFNLLTITAAIFILDDSILSKTKSAVGSTLAAQTKYSYASLIKSLAGAFVAIIHLGIIQHRIAPESAYTQWLSTPALKIDQLRLFHPYGLFANMTESRPEIRIEGSHDGKNWKPYEFKYKPNGPSHIPTFINPHMPRLDWQMWFAALQRDCTQNSGNWYLHFLVKLFQNEPHVTNLLHHNPFEHLPPRYIRSKVSDFEFQYGQAHHWWEQKSSREYCPTLTWVDGRLEKAAIP